MTFLQYITRKSGMGRTGWVQFAIIRVLAPLAIVGGGWIVWGEGDPWGWPVMGVGAVIYIGVLIGTWSNWKDDRAREEAGPANPLNHHVDLWDAALYVCIHGVKPHKRTKECAWPIMHDLDLYPNEPTPQEKKIQRHIQ